MKELWTGNLIGRMHNAGITRRELAEELGVSRAYISMVLNGNRTPINAKEKFEEAFKTVYQNKNLINK